jgi:hypothetical protein
MAPKLQVKRLPAILHTPCVVVEDTIGAGSVSARVTSAASPGPPLLTVIVKVTKDPAFTEAGELTLICTSEKGDTNGVTVFDGSDSALLPVALVA